MNRTLQDKLAELEQRAKQTGDKRERITFSVNQATAQAFKAICDKKGIEYSHVVELFLRDYVDSAQAQVVSINRSPTKVSGRDE